MTMLPRIASRLFNTPLLIQPDIALAIAGNLSERFGIDMAGRDPAVHLSPEARSSDRSEADDEAPYTIHDGIATIAIQGELINRGSWISSVSGLVSYEQLCVCLRQAEADPNVSGILLDIDSPGGEAAGAMEAAAVIRDVAGTKPVKAFVNSLAASAGYALAAGAADITVTPSSTVGSIGVVMMHVDRSEALGKAGLKPTLIHAGAYKVDGHPIQPLDDDVRSRLQARIDASYDLFVASVASHRPMTDAAIRGTEAGVFMGEAAVKVGLADRVGTREDVLASFPPAGPVPAPYSLPFRGSSMSQPAETISRANHDAALASATASAHAEGLAAGTAAGASAERERIAGILGCDEATDREASARHLALNTSLDLASARGALSGLALASPPAAPAAAPASKTHRLDAIVPQPKVGADAGDDGEPKSETEKGLSAFARALGRPLQR